MPEVQYNICAKYNRQQPGCSDSTAVEPLRNTFATPRRHCSSVNSCGCAQLLLSYGVKQFASRGRPKKAYHGISEEKRRLARASV